MAPPHPQSAWGLFPARPHHTCFLFASIAAILLGRGSISCGSAWLRAACTQI